MLFRQPERPVPPGHPLHGLFRQLTARAMAQVGLQERDLISYLPEMLVRFVHVDALYRLRDAEGARVEYLFEMIGLAEETGEGRRRAAYRHVGDFALFILGFYPERLERPGRPTIGPDDWAEQGRLSYARAAEAPGDEPPSPLLRKLAGTFESCAVGLNWVRQYTHDPFYQYILRQFGVV
jgi:hypothetical protein